MKMKNVFGKFDNQLSEKKMILKFNITKRDKYGTT